jgi:hypothetical protein
MFNVNDLQMDWNTYSGLSFEQKAELLEVQSSYLKDAHAQALIDKTWAIFVGADTVPVLTGSVEGNMPSDEECIQLGQKHNFPVFIHCTVMEPDSV